MVINIIFSASLFWLITLYSLVYNGSYVFASSIPEEQITVSFLENNAFYRTSANTIWQLLQLGQLLMPESEIKTEENTRLILRLGDGSEVRVAPNSHLRINSQTTPDQNNFDFQLILGRAWATFRKNVTRTSHLILRTAHAKIDIQGTSYEVSTNQGATDVYVFSGQVKISNNEASKAQEMEDGQILGPQEVAPPREITLDEWHVVVAAFQRITITSGQQPQKPIKFALQEVENAWVQWNLKQDRF